MSTKILDKNNSQEISNHLLDFVIESGCMPALFLSDKGEAQSLEDVQKLVTGFQSLAQEENLRRIKENRRNEFVPPNLTPPQYNPHTGTPHQTPPRTPLTTTQVRRTPHHRTQTTPRT